MEGISLSSMLRNSLAEGFRTETLHRALKPLHGLASSFGLVD